MAIVTMKKANRLVVHLSGRKHVKKRSARYIKKRRVYFKKRRAAYLKKKLRRKTPERNRYRECMRRCIANVRADKQSTTKKPSLRLNIDFYNAIDGVYNSYWTGKLVSTLQREGKKKRVARCFYTAATIVKLSLGTSPLLILLEMLDKAKPTFRLRNRFARRSVIKEYPIVVFKPRQLILAVHWLKEEIQTNYNNFGTPLATEIAERLLDFKLNPKKNKLIKKRDEYIKRIVRGQFNIRYNFR